MAKHEAEPMSHDGTGAGTQAPPRPAAPGALIPRAQRQAGLDRFDEAIVVTRTRAWIGLLACLVLLAGVVLWSLTATINKTVTGNGVALVNGTISRATSPATGTIVSLQVGAGQLVKAAQPIGTVQTPSGQRVAVKAPITGKALNVTAGAGASVIKGQTLASLSAVHGPRVLVAMLNPAQAQAVASQDPVSISLPQGGTLKGVVSHVGELPLTRQEVADVIGSPAVASSVAAGYPVTPVTIYPTDQARAARLLGAGNVAVATIIVGTAHPIDYVF